MIVFGGLQAAFFIERNHLVHVFFPNLFTKCHFFGAKTRQIVVFFTEIFIFMILYHLSFKNAIFIFKKYR